MIRQLLTMMILFLTHAYPMIVVNAETCLTTFFVGMCMFAIVANLAIFRSSVHNEISAATVAGVAVLYGAVYYLMAVTVLTEKTTFLGILFVVLAAHTAVLVMLTGCLRNSIIPHVLMLGTHIFPTFWLMVSKGSKGMDSLALIALLTVVIISVRLINKAMPSHEWTSIVDIGSTLAFGIAMESVITNAGVKCVIGVITMAGMLVQVLSRMPIPLAEENFPWL